MRGWNGIGIHPYLDKLVYYKAYRIHIYYVSMLLFIISSGCAEVAICVQIRSNLSMQYIRRNEIAAAVWRYADTHR